MIWQGGAQISLLNGINCGLGALSPQPFANASGGGQEFFSIPLHHRCLPAGRGVRPAIRNTSSVGCPSPSAKTARPGCGRKVPTRRLSASTPDGAVCPQLNPFFFSKQGFHSALSKAEAAAFKCAKAAAPVVRQGLPDPAQALPDLPVHGEFESWRSPFIPPSTISGFGSARTPV